MEGQKSLVLKLEFWVLKNLAKAIRSSSADGASKDGAEALKDQTDRVNPIRIRRIRPISRFWQIILW